MPKHYHFTERRQHPRIRIPNGTAALVIDNQTKMGEIIDISLGGVSFEYPESRDPDLTGATGRINILIQNSHFRMENIPCKVITDIIQTKKDSTRSCPLKRCGLQYEALARSHIAQLTHEIEKNDRYRETLRYELLEKKRKNHDEKYRSILENIEEGYFEVDLSGNVTFFNSAMLKIVGYNAEEGLGVNYRQFTDPATAEKVFREYNKAYRTGILPQPFDWEFVKKNGRKIQVETSLAFIKDAQDKIIGFRGIARDISQRKTFEQKLLYMASHDQLTGLFNRTAFFERLRETLACARRFKKKYALFFLDLDNFKTVNDSHGHEAGDRILQKAASRLTRILRETDYIFRHGGDEFTIILNNPENTNLVVVARKIIDKIGEPYYIENLTIDFITTSIGISVYPDDGADIHDMVKHADKAMYQAKKQKNQYLFYNQGEFAKTVALQ